MTKVFHAEIFGTRESKYKWLNSHDISTTKWKKLNPKTEFYLFIPQNERNLKQYQSYYKVSDIFPVNSVGIVTSRDELTIHYTKEGLWNAVRNFSNLEIELARETYHLGKDSKDWNIESAQNDIQESEFDKEKMVPVLYRPFDIRYTYYTGKTGGFICRPRGDIMKHLIKDNLAICVGRQGSATGSNNYDIVFISDKIVDLNLYRRGGELVFPLYVYPDKPGKKKSLHSQLMMFEPAAVYQARQPNIKPELFEELKLKYKKDVTPEEIFYYIYAVLYSNTYRAKFAEFLKMDFPRIPFSDNYKIFIKLGKLGMQLAGLHLLKSKELEKPIAKFPVDGSNKVEKLIYTTVEAGHPSRHGLAVTDAPSLQSNCVYINKEQYFKNVPEEIWHYQIGGYQVCEKWLKDRKGRKLTLDEITTYCNIVTALSKTIEIQKKIDELYKSVEE